MCCCWYYLGLYFIGIRKPLHESDGSRLSRHFEAQDHQDHDVKVYVAEKV